MAVWDWERQIQRQRQSWVARIDTTLRYIYSEAYFSHNRLIQNRSSNRRPPPRLSPKKTCVYSADCSSRLSPGLENFRHNIFFWHPHIILPAQFRRFPHAIHMAFLPSLVYLKMQVQHPVLKSTTNMAYQRSICNNNSHEFQSWRLTTSFWCHTSAN